MDYVRDCHDCEMVHNLTSTTAVLLSTSDSANTGTTNTSAIIGWVLFCVAMVLLIVGVVVYNRCKRNKCGRVSAPFHKKQRESETHEDNPDCPQTCLIHPIPTIIITQEEPVPVEHARPVFRHADQRKFSKSPPVHSSLNQMVQYQWADKECEPDVIKSNDVS